MTSMKLCKICNCMKPHNATTMKDSKASGFKGAKCWNCYLPQHAEVNKNWYAANFAKACKLTQHNYLARSNRTPPWADLGKIKQIYVEAAEKGLTVDHVLPLLGEFVSGLHVHNNLQMLTKSENSIKSNIFRSDWQ